MATRTVGTKLTIDGEAEFTKAVKNAQLELKNMRSELVLVNTKYSENANSATALKAKLEALTKVKAAQTKVVEELKAGLANAQKAQSQYGSEVDSLKKKISDATARLEEQQKATGDTGEEQKKLNAEIESYKKQLEIAESAQKIATESVESWQNKLNTAETQLNKTDTEIIKNERYLNEAKHSADKCATSIDQYGRKVKTAGEESKTFKDKLSDSSAAISELANVLNATGLNEALSKLEDLLNDCADAAINFETSMAKVETLVDTSIYSMDDLEKELTELSAETGKAVTGLAEAAYQALSAGVDVKNVSEFVEYASKLATGGFTDETAAVDILTTALNAYNLEADQTQQISDYLITTQNLGKITVDELASSMGRVIPTAAAYNVQMDQLSSAYAVLTKNGINARNTTTYLSGMLDELGDSGSTVANILVNKTGKSFSQLMAEGYSLGDVMGILGDSVNGSTDAFAELWSSSTAGKAALTIYQSGVENFNAVLYEMQNSLGATEAAYEIMADTTEHAQEKFNNSISLLKIAIGNELTPALDSLYETGADAFEWATEFVEEHPEVVAAMAAVVVGLTVMAGGVAILGAAITALNALLSLSNPIGLIAVAATAAVAALTTLIVSLASINREENSAADQARDLTGRVKELTQAVQENSAAYADNNANITDSANNYRQLATQLQEMLNAYDGTESSLTAVQAVVDQLNEAIPDLALSFDEETGAINMSTAALEKAIDSYEALSEYDAAVERQSQLLQEKAQITEDLTEAQEGYNAALKEMEKYSDTDLYKNEDAREAVNIAAEYKRNLDALTEAADDNAAALEEVNQIIDGYVEVEKAAITSSEDAKKRIDELIDSLGTEGDAAEDTTEKLEELDDALIAYAQYCSEAADSIEAQMEELQVAYGEAYNSAYDSISGQIGLFDEMSSEAEQSISDLISALKSQTDYMYTYAENIQRAMEMGVDEGIIQSLSDGSEESAKYLAAIVEGGEEDIAALNEAFGQVEEGKKAFASSVAEMETDFANQMQAIADECSAMVEELDQHDAAYSNAVNTCNGILSGVDSMWSDVTAKYRALGEAASAAYNQALEVNSPSKKFQRSTEMTMLGITGTVEKDLPKIEKSYKSVAESAMDAYQEQMEDMERGMKGAEDALAAGTYFPEKIKKGITENQLLETIHALTPGNRQGQQGDAKVQITQNVYANETDYAGQQKEAARQMKQIARMVLI